MNFELTTNRFMNIDNKNIKKYIKELYDLFIKESLKGNKVAFYYENINNNDILTFNKEIGFYAASTIKILACIMLFKKADNNEIDLNNKILVKVSDLRPGTGILKNNKEDKYYTLLKLIELTIRESDNTAYLKLVDILTKDKIKEYGNKLGATLTMVGKETDSFGAINCIDMIIYWKHLKEYIDSNNKYSKTFKKYLLTPSLKEIEDISINNRSYVRKYGAFGIAFHEAGYIDDNKPYYLIILTQLNEKNYRYKFINKAAKLINKINEESR